jgi:hypothetical protein
VSGVDELLAALIALVVAQNRAKTASRAAAEVDALLVHTSGHDSLPWLVSGVNKPFSAWGEIFGDDMAATAMIDRLIHHSEILSSAEDLHF